MTSDQLAPEQRAGSEIFFGMHSSWGLGIAVDVRRHEIYHNPGRYGWTGGFGTTAYIDPAEGMIGSLFTQRMMDSPEPPRIFTDFWTLGVRSNGITTRDPVVARNALQATQPARCSKSRMNPTRASMPSSGKAL
jgi:CubicO group peptidase (beta-lactamase class C family)